METRPPAQRIIDAALTCIARVGLAKTTLDDVAREACCARATVYRCFPGKQQLLAALVQREVTALGAGVVDAAAAGDTLGDAVTLAITTAARTLTNHRALAFVASYEPELLLPYLAFEREDAVLRAAGALVAPAFERFLPTARATPFLVDSTLRPPPVAALSSPCLRLGEWIARITLSYLCSPSESIDICDPAHVRALVDDFVLPGFVRPVNSEGVSR